MPEDLVLRLKHLRQVRNYAISRTLLAFQKTDHTKEKMDEEMVHVVVIQFEINLFNRKKVMKNIILFKIWGANNLKKLDAFQCFVLVSENLPGFSRTFRRWSNPLR